MELIVLGVSFLLISILSFLHFNVFKKQKVFVAPDNFSGNLDLNERQINSSVCSVSCEKCDEEKLEVECNCNVFKNKILKIKNYNLKKVVAFNSWFSLSPELKMRKQLVDFYKGSKVVLTNNKISFKIKKNVFQTISKRKTSILSHYKQGENHDVFVVKIKNNSNKCTYNKVQLITDFNNFEPNVQLGTFRKENSVLVGDDLIYVKAKINGQLKKLNMFLNSTHTKIYNDCKIKVPPNDEIEVMFYVKIVCAMQSEKSLKVKPNLHCLNSSEMIEVFNSNLAFNIETKNKLINKLINVDLPKQIINLKEKINKDVFVFENTNQLKHYGVNKIIKWLLLRKEFVRLYHYIMVNVLGLMVYKDKVLFFKNAVYQSEVVLNVNGKTIKKFNRNENYYFILDGVIYRNVSSIAIDSLNLFQNVTVN